MTKPAKRAVPKRNAKPVVVAARNPQLEEAVAAAPDDPAGYIVYGDWLQREGDPRGELIALQAAQRTADQRTFARLKVAEHELLSKWAEHFYGDACRFPAARKSHLHWSLGFIESF